MADAKKSPKSKPEKSAPKKNADGKPSILGRIKQFFKDVRGESKKIAWQSWPDTIKNTGVVLMVTVVIGAGVWLSDLLFRQLFDLLYRIAGTGTAEAGMIMLQNLF